MNRFNVLLLALISYRLEGYITNTATDMKRGGSGIDNCCETIK